jgi:hypothetical protein
VIFFGEFSEFSDLFFELLFFGFVLGYVSFHLVDEVDHIPLLRLGVVHEILEGFLVVGED